MGQEINDINFDKKIIKANKPVLVYFWADWCGPCKIFSPQIDELSNKYKDKVFIYKINIDNNNNKKNVIKYSIKSIPTLIFFKNGKEIDRSIGIVSIDTINNKLNELL
ncbi:MAG: thioredoxin [Candidatus Bostrichicola ureolyticus]|nr:MAG: thioredoxin [Candidatus Bostrichicola ureolyticus]